MLNSSKLRLVIALTGACLMLGLWSERASAQVVDCDSGGSIQTAIDGGQRVVEFTGTCAEFVSIYRDRAEVRGVSGNPALDVITGGMSVRGAQRILIEDLTISGDSFFIMDGAFATVRNSIIENTDFGFGVLRNSGARLEGNTFGPALIDGTQSCLPICVLDNSHARMENNTVTGAANDSRTGGVMTVLRDSSVMMRGGNTITNTGTKQAISVFFDSHLRQDNSSGFGTGQINGRVEVSANSYFGTREAVINGDVRVTLHSVMRIASTATGGDPSLMQVNGGIHLSGDSALRVSSPLVTINGDVTCEDGESSARGDFAGTGKNLCSEFSSVDSDFNGDGKADLLWRNGSNGATVIWLMDGATQLSAGSIGNVPLTWQIDKVEDFNGDGKSDIFWRNSTTGANVVWLMDGFAKTVQSASPVPTVWQTQPSGAGLD
jgi:hypothetical protein